MADFLKAVKSVRDQKQGSEPSDLLTARGTRRLNGAVNTPRERQQDGITSRLPGSTGQVTTSPRQSPVDEKPALIVTEVDAYEPVKTATAALQILRSHPSSDNLLVVLERLSTGSLEPSFSLDVPGPVQAQVINTLLMDIVPNFWPSLGPRQRNLLTSCLCNVAGLNAISARLRLLASQKTSLESTTNLLDLMTKIFSGDDMVTKIFSGVCRSIADDRKRQMLWKEFINLIGSGKVIAAVAQAEDAAKSLSKSGKVKSSWLASGADYCSWLGRSIALLALGPTTDGTEAPVATAALLLAKALHLGDSGQLLHGLLRTSSHDGQTFGRDDRINTLIQSLPAYAQRTFVENVLRWLSSTIALVAEPQQGSRTVEAVSGIAGLLSILVGSSEGGRLQHLESHLTDPTLSSLISLTVRRAILAVVANRAEDDLPQQLLEKLIPTFSTTLFIAHAPIAQQEGLAQTILISAGYVHRKRPMSLLMTARSSGHMQGVSARLDSSNSRARWLGMVVGMALSKLVDKPGSQMDFATEETKSEDAMWYANLTDVNDAVGTIEDFDRLLAFSEQSRKTLASRRQPSKTNGTLATINGKPVFGPARPPTPAKARIVGDRVTEITENGSDEEDQLKPYAKPDSDPEDSDEDATLVNRNKAKAPVYIRDLMAGLRDDKTYDRFSLAVKTAASLIRRKASFGKEVKDHAEELAGMLCNLQDPFDMDDFDDYRLQALIAVLSSDAKVVAPLLTKQAFAEGYSIAQRCVILSALGLGGRELAGFKIEDEDYNPKQNKIDFPSKRLPPRLHSIYSSSSNTQPARLEAASKSLEHQMIQPMALQAADQSTSHLNTVKVRTFSSRMDVEKARTKRKPSANDLAKCFGEAFFFPLANRYQQEVAAYGFSSVYVSAPIVLVTFIKTLALLLHASGPATLGLPQVSAEFWDLLLSLRVQALQDIGVLQAVLFALLTLLEVNTDQQRLVQEQPRQLMETQTWVDLVFERMGSSGLIDEEAQSEEAKVRTLAAGVLMKCREIIEAYQKQLVGYGFG